MKSIRGRAMRALGGTVLACGALLALTPGATAVTAPAASEAATLASPTLTSVTKDGDNMIVVWKASSSTGVKDYVLYANGRFVQRMTPGDEVPEERWLVNVASRGLTGEETLTVAAEDSAGNLSAPSNGMVATAPVTLDPTPRMTSAVIKGDRVTLTWTASHTDEASGVLWYGFLVDGQSWRGGIKDATSATLPVSNDDPVLPVVVRPGSRITVVATDYTSLNHSEQSNVMTATLG